MYTLWLRQPCKHGTTQRDMSEKTEDTNNERRTPYSHESIPKERLSIVRNVNNSPKLVQAYGFMCRSPRGQVGPEQG